jgi:hypothetical protein
MAEASSLRLNFSQLRLGSVDNEVEGVEGAGGGGGGGAGGGSGGSSSARGAAAEGGGSEQPAGGEKTIATLAAGDSVSVKYRGKEWRSATVVGVRPEGSFDVAFGDDDYENGVPPSMLRLRESPRNMSSSSPVGVVREQCRRSVEKARDEQKRRRGPRPWLSCAMVTSLQHLSHASLLARTQNCMYSCPRSL